MRLFLRTTSLTILCALALFSHAQPPIEWQVCLGSEQWDYAHSIEQTYDGGYIVAGHTLASNVDSADAWVLKLDAFGAIEWERVMGGTYWDQATSTQQTADSGYIVAGWTESNDGDVSGKHGGLYSADLWLVKLDSLGTIEWQKCLGGSGDDFANDVDQTADGGYVLTGLTYSNDGDVTDYNGGAPDVWVVKVDAWATVQWGKSFGGSSYEYSLSVQQTNDTGFVVAGYTNSTDGEVNGNHGDIDAWLLKLDANGLLQWQKCLGGVDDEYGMDISQTMDGGYLFTGNTDSNDGDASGNHGGRDGWVVKLDSIGALEWQRCLGGTSGDYATSSWQTVDGGYIVAGTTYSNNGDVSGFHGGADQRVVKLDSSGTVQWQKCMGGLAAEQAHGIQQTADGGYVVVGETASTDGDVSGNHGIWDGWVVKLGPAEVGITELAVPGFTIAPNPTSSTVLIEVEPGAQASSVSIMESTGRVMLTQSLSRGQRPITVDLNALATGVYFIQLNFAEGSSAVQRVAKH